MKEFLKEIFWDDVKEDVKFFMKNFKEIVRKTWYDFLDEFKND